MKGYTMSLPFATSEHHLDAAELETALLNTEETDMGSLHAGDRIILHNVPVLVTAHLMELTGRSGTVSIEFEDEDGHREQHSYYSGCKIDRIKPIA